MARVDLSAAQAFYPELASAMKLVPAYHNDLAAPIKAQRTAQLDAVKALIEARGGRVDQRWDGTTISLFGLRASSTTGFEGAVRNWTNQLTVKSSQANMAGAR